MVKNKKKYIRLFVKLLLHDFTQNFFLLGYFDKIKLKAFFLNSLLD